MLARLGSGACAVCGWSSDEGASAPARYCACCGIERGVQDRTSAEVKSWRSKWLTGGGRWQGPAKPMLAEEPVPTVPSVEAPRRL